MGYRGPQVVKRSRRKFGHIVIVLVLVLVIVFASGAAATEDDYEHEYDYEYEYWVPRTDRGPSHLGIDIVPHGAGWLLLLARRDSVT